MEKDKRTFRIIGAAIEVQSADFAEKIKDAYGIMEIGFVDQ